MILVLARSEDPDKYGGGRGLSFFLVEKSEKVIVRRIEKAVIRGYDGTPTQHTNATDPKDGMSQAWDDMMNAPARMGRVPPGWKAPTIDIPNPIDVGDEFEKNARRAPHIIRDNFTFN